MDYLNECSVIENELFCDFLNDFAVRMSTREKVNEVNLSIVDKIDLNDFCKNDARMVEIKLYGSVNLINGCFSPGFKFVGPQGTWLVEAHF